MGTVEYVVTSLNIELRMLTFHKQAKDMVKALHSHTPPRQESLLRTWRNIHCGAWASHGTKMTARISPIAWWQLSLQDEEALLLESGCSFVMIYESVQKGETVSLCFWYECFGKFFCANINHCCIIRMATTILGGLLQYIHVAIFAVNIKSGN